MLITPALFGAVVLVTQILAAAAPQKGQQQQQQQQPLKYEEGEEGDYGLWKGEERIKPKPVDLIEEYVRTFFPFLLWYFVSLLAS